MEFKDYFGYYVSNVFNRYYIDGINRDNCRKFPNNYFMPKKLDSGEIIHLIRFSSLNNLYEYLTSDPVINSRIFKQLHSSENDYDFAGKSYEEALKDLISNNYNSDYQEFLKLQKELENCINRPIHKYKTVRTLSGGHLNVPAYSAGVPLCYETEERIISPKFVRIDATVGYTCSTTKNQVFNRAIIMTNILKALENAGYRIDLNTFELSNIGMEYVHLVFKVKNYNEMLNMQTLYKILCQVEFLRRILFRVLETTGIYGYRWGRNYGDCIPEDKVRQILNLKENDIYFDEPRNMGINGYDLADDFEAAVNHINLADKIDVENAKRKFREKVKRLSLNN